MRIPFDRLLMSGVSLILATACQGNSGVLTDTNNATNQVAGTPKPGADDPAPDASPRKEEPADLDPIVAPDLEPALAALPKAEIASASQGVPTFVRGDLGALSGTVTADNADLMLQPVLGAITAVFRLEPASLVFVRAEVDELGYTHARYRQVKSGVDVVGGELIVHVDSHNVVYAANGTATDGFALDTTAFVSAQTATDVAKQYYASGAVTYSQPRLTYILGVADRQMALAWETVAEGMVGDMPVRDIVYVDAKRGTHIETHSLIHPALSRKVYSANNTNSLPGTLKISEGGPAVSDQSVMRAYDTSGIVYNCYHTLFSRDSYNNAGAQLLSTVHYGTSYGNAFWNGTEMVYGDGDGVNLGDLTLSFDVGAHELSHGVIEYTANLVYQNEPGALNEAWADIMAAICEAWSDGSISADTWKLGEDVWTPGTAGDALRYMDNPTADDYSADYYPERLTGSSDNGGVHGNNGIANLAFKLLVTGGTHPRSKTTNTVPALGIDHAQRIFYRALAQYMTSSTDFAGARSATSQAAQDLYGASAASAVNETWNAVGVPGGATPPPPATALQNGVPASSLSGSLGSTRQFTLAVPSGASNLKFAISGGSGDADLYVRFGAPPTTSTYDCRPYLSGNSESCAMSTASAGTWYVMLNAYSSYSGVSLVGSFTTSGGGGGSVVALQNGVPVSSLSGAAQSTAYFKLDVPAGASALKFALSGGTGDADLYVRYGSQPTTTAYDCRPYLSGNDETCAMSSATSGTWYVMVRGYSAYSGASLVGSFTASTDTTPGLQNAVPVNNISGAASSATYYKLEVPAGASNLKFVTNGGAGDADLYVRFGSKPTTATYDCRPYTTGNDETCAMSAATAGTWYVMIRGYTSYSGLSLTGSHQ